ncbi:substrate-binding domain-containing protein, partial [candidate division KSB1 bacterium]|nr:substrate-binding domain-containing protein [candidate division KSB1 bacterium]
MSKPLVGILISEPAKPTFWGIYHYIIDVVEEELKKYNFKAVHVNFHYNFDEAYQQCHSLLEQNVNGIIFNSVSSEYDYSVNKKIVEIFERQRIPVILIDKYFLNEPQNYSYITSDNFNGGFQATEHLIRLGYRRIAHIRYADSSSAQLREQGFRNALFCAGIRADENIIKGFFGLPQLYQILDSFFKSQIIPPGAIFTINDLVAHKVYAYLSEIGLRIPQDVAIVGFDDLPNAEQFDPPLTTIKQDFLAMGKAAVAYLLRRIEKFTQLPQAIIPCELVVRESCGSKLKRNVSFHYRSSSPEYSAPILNDSNLSKTKNKIGILYGYSEKLSYRARNYTKIIEGIENTVSRNEYEPEFSQPFTTKNEEY